MIVSSIIVLSIDTDLFLCSYPMYIFLNSKSRIIHRSRPRAWGSFLVKIVVTRFRHFCELTCCQFVLTCNQQCNECKLQFVNKALNVLITKILNTVSCQDYLRKSYWSSPKSLKPCSVSVIVQTDILKEKEEKGGKRRRVRQMLVVNLIVIG